MTDRTPPADSRSGAARAGEVEPDLSALFQRIPTVDAVRRPFRLWGLQGWGLAQWAGLVAASVGFFFAYRGLNFGLGWGAFAVVAALVAGFVVATYLPRRGVKSGAAPCALVPLAMTLLVPALANPAEPLTAAIGLALLIAVASQRLTGAGCG